MEISRFQFLRIILIQPWKIIVSGIISLIGIYDLFLSQFLTKNLSENYPNVAEIIIRLGWPWWIWFIVVLVMIIIFMFEGSFRYLQQYFEPPQLIELSKLRTEGVALRNQGMTILSAETLDSWIQKFNSWEESVLRIMAQVSASRSEILRTLDRFNGITYPNALNSKHRLYLRIFDAKLERLRKDIEDLRAGDD